MKQFVWLLTAIIIIFFLASCSTPEKATPTLWVAQITPDATSIPTPEPPTRVAPTAIPTTTDTSAQAIPTIATIANQPPARLVIEEDQSAESDQGRVYRFVLYDAQGFFGIQFDLSFDPALITVVDSDDGLPGVQIVPGDPFPRGKSFVAVNEVEQGLGTLKFAATRVKPLEPLDGKIQVASMTIQTAGNTSAEISFGQVLLSDEAANSLPVAPEGIVVGNDS